MSTRTKSKTRRGGEEIRRLRAEVDRLAQELARARLHLPPPAPAEVVTEEPIECAP